MMKIQKIVTTTISRKSLQINAKQVFQSSRMQKVYFKPCLTEISDMIHISHNMPEHQKKEYFESLGLDWSNINKYYYTVNNLNTIYNTNSQKYYLYKNVKLFKNVYNNYFNLYNNYFKTTIVMMHMILLWMVYIKTYLLTHLNRI